MRPVVRSLTLERFRSVRAGQIEFDNPTFLVGRNGSGKSNIADAFAFLSEAMTSQLQEVFDRRGGTDSVLTKTFDDDLPAHLGMAIELNPNELIKTKVENLEGDVANAHYAFEISTLPDYKFEIVREQCVLSLRDGTKKWFDRTQDQMKTNVEPFRQTTFKVFARGALSLPSLSGVLPFEIVTQILRSMSVYSIEPSKLRDMQDPDGGTRLRGDGANAASVFEEIERRSPQDVQRISEFLSTIVPNTKTVDTIQHGKKLALEFTQEWNGGRKLDFEAFNMSDGTLRAFGLLLAVFQRSTPSLIVVEEPEASMHPAAAGAILDLLRHASKQMQVVVSTHSPEILDARWIEDRHLRIVNWQEGATTVSRVSDMSRKALQDHLMGAGELLRSEALEPDPLFDDAPEQQGNLFEEVN